MPVPGHVAHGGLREETSAGGESWRARRAEGRPSSCCWYIGAAVEFLSIGRAVL